MHVGKYFSEHFQKLQMWLSLFTAEPLNSNRAEMRQFKE